MNLCVLSACYEKPELASILVESCKMFGLDLVMCEASELKGVWPASGDMRVGKLVAALETLRVIKKMRSFTHVLWADGFDTFIANPRPNLTAEARIFYNWSKMGCPPLVLSAEKNCWPDEELKDMYPPSRSEYRFINAGTWMGQVDYVIDVLTQMVDVMDVNDQRTWTQFYLDHLLPGAVIDTERKIFQTMWGTDLRSVSLDASVIHYNGGIWRNPEDLRMIEHWECVKSSWLKVS